jgi:putative tryptophan/tyrosine transport system ATP-binding protein
VGKLRPAAGVVPLALIAACSTKPVTPRAIIGLAQVSSAKPLDDARDAFYRALADSGYVRDSTITILERNAQGDIPTLSLIMSEFKQQGATHVATISSVATQAALKAITDRPIIFGAVANPYIIGAGTSLTKHRLAGVFLPDSGTIRIAGTDVSRQPEFRRAALIGRVFQDPFKGTCPSMTVAENLRMAELRGGRRSLRVGLSHSALDRYRKLLAGLGMRLDPRAADQVVRVTGQVVRENALTTLMVTHSMEQALELGDRTIMMHKGEVLADLSGGERQGLNAGDLLQRFTELRYTIEFAVASRPAGGVIARGDWICTR